LIQADQVINKEGKQQKSLTLTERYDLGNTINHVFEWAAFSVASLIYIDVHAIISYRKINTDIEMSAIFVLLVRLQN